MTTTFEDRLAAELHAIVATNPAPATTAPNRYRRRGFALGGVAAAAATAAIVLLQSGASPAYAVDKAPDGTVTVTIDRAADAAGLQQALRDQGVNAYVDYLPAGKTCAPGRFTPASGGPSTVSMRVTESGPATFTIASNQLGAGNALVIEDTADGDLSGLRVAFATGEVKPCTQVDGNIAPQPSTGTVVDGGGPSVDQQGTPGVSGDGKGLYTHQETLPPR